jgi:uncharacterized protein (DUF302 family)
MRLKINSLLAAVVALALIAPVQAAKAPETRNDYRVTYVVKAKYDDVREQVVQAINGKGIQINNISYIGAMLIRTGKDLGYTKQVYTKAQAFEFCSATVSRFTMEADPHNMVFCPYIIAVYELAGQEGTIYVSYRRPELVGSEQSKKTLQDVENLLEEIVQEALSWF